MNPSSPTRRLLGQAQRAQRAPMMVAAVCACLAGLASVILLGAAGWFIGGAAIAGAAGASLAFNFMLPSAAIRLCAITRTIGRYGERLESHRAALFALASIRPRLFEAIAAAPPTEALALSTGEASARLVQDVDALESLVVRVSARWGYLAGALAGVALASLAAPLAGLASGLACMAALAAGLAITRCMADEPGRALQRAIGRLKETYAGLMAAAPEIACYGLQDWASGEVVRAGEGVARARKALARTDGLQAAVCLALAAIAAVSALLLAASAPRPMAFMAALAAAAAVEATSGLVKGLSADGAARQAMRRLDEVLGPAPAVGSDAGSPGERLVLPVDEATVVLEPGERLAIVGQSGCGKTTLVEQLIGLRPRRAGEGGSSAGRALFSYAPQDAALLAGTVRQNLALADPLASEHAMWSALADAALAVHVRALPQGLDAWIGDGGARLSGGERRRLSLARALLRPAPWLVLDEPTDGLDAETEARVVEGVSARLARTGQGLILVSHRLAPLALCGRVLSLDARRLERAA